MNILRRNVLKGAGAASAVSVAIAAGLMKPGAVFAAEWNKSVFESKDLGGVMKAVGGAGAVEPLLAETDRDEVERATLDRDEVRDHIDARRLGGGRQPQGALALDGHRRVQRPRGAGTGRAHRPPGRGAGGGHFLEAGIGEEILPEA